MYNGLIKSAGEFILKDIGGFFPFWDKLDEKEKALLLHNLSTVRFSKGNGIHKGETDCVGLLLVKTGHLRVYMLSEEGREITLYRLHDGDICVLSASCVLSSITFDVHIDAEEDSEVYMLNSSTFSALLKNNIHVECFSYKLTAERFSEVMWAMQQILFMSFDRRLAIFLSDEAAKTGSDTISLTHEQVAKYIGSAREVVTRMLKYFSDEGIVSLSRGAITLLDKKKLRGLI